MPTRDSETTFIMLLGMIFASVVFDLHRETHAAEQYAEQQRVYDREFDIMKTHYRETA